MLIMRYITTLCLLMLLSHEAHSQSQGCIYMGGYPWQTGGCLVANDLNNAIAGRNPLLSTPAVPNKWVNYFKNGEPIMTQPKFSDIAGTLPPDMIPPASSLSPGGVFASTAPASQFFYSLDGTGHFVSRQPSFLDIAGVAAPTQIPFPSNTGIGGVKSYTAPAGQYLTGVATDGTLISEPMSVSGGVAGPVVSTTNDFALWSNATGTILSNGGDTPIVNTHIWPASLGSTPTDGVKFQFGTVWTASQLIPAGVLQGVVSTLTIPSSYTQGPWPNTNFSGYCDNQNTTVAGNSCVPYFSVGLANGGANSTAYGTNQIISNTDKNHYLVGPGFGKDFGALFGNECNPNVWTKTGGTIPAGYVRCFEAIGGGNVIPSGGATAYHVSPFYANQGWTTGFEIADGGAVNGIALGAVGTGISQTSLGINFRVYNSSAAERTASIYAAPNATGVELRLAANDANGRVTFNTLGGQQYYIDATGFHGITTALGLNAAGPFVYINAMAGRPTGTPTATFTGASPLVIDTTNHSICWFEQPTGLWKCATGT